MRHRLIALLALVLLSALVPGCFPPRAVHTTLSGPGPSGGDGFVWIGEATTLETGVSQTRVVVCHPNRTPTCVRVSPHDLVGTGIREWAGTPTPPAEPGRTPPTETPSLPPPSGM